VRLNMALQLVRAMPSDGHTCAIRTRLLSREGLLRQPRARLLLVAQLLRIRDRRGQPAGPGRPLLLCDPHRVHKLLCCFDNAAENHHSSRADLNPHITLHDIVVCYAQALKILLTSATALVRRLHAATASPAWPAPASTRSPSSASPTSTPASAPAAWTRSRTAAASAAPASASRVHRDKTRHACCRRQPQAAEGCCGSEGDDHCLRS